MVDQEIGEVEPVLFSDIAREHGLAAFQRVGLGRLLGERQTLLSHDPRSPAHTGLDQGRLAALLDFQNLREIGAERFRDQPAGLLQHLVESITAKGEVAETGQHLLSNSHLLEVRHLGVWSRDLMV